MFDDDDDWGRMIIFGVELQPSWGLLVAVVTALALVGWVTWLSLQTVAAMDG